MAARQPKAGGKFTNKELESLGPGNAGDSLREASGLVGEVRASDMGDISIYWSWRYRFEGKVRELRLGTWPKLSMPQIREGQQTCAHELNGGKDPAAERRAAKLKTKANQAEAIAHEQSRLAEVATQAARMTVNDLFERWQRLELSGRKDKGAETTRTFDRDVLPQIGHQAAEDIKRAHVARVLDAVVERGARIVARNLLGDIRQMFGFAIRRGLLENDPTSHMKRDDYGKKVERDRVLSEAEIRTLPGMLETSGMLPTSQAAIWLMLSTCCRIGELSSAKWADVDLEATTWRIPPDNSKNGKEHVVHLSPFAVHHFMTIKAYTGESEWVLPDRHDKGPVCSKSITKQIGDRQRNNKPLTNRAQGTDTLKLPGGRWTPHDLRRTGATLMVGLGVLPEVVERCLNHVEQNKVKRIYQRHDYVQEMRAAWLLLGERLDLLCRADAENVLTFQRKAA